MSEKCISCESIGPKWLQRLNKLLKENPEAEVIHMVSEEANCGEWSRQSCPDISVDLTQYTINEDGKMLQDEEEVEDWIAGAIAQDPEWTDEQLEKAIERETEKFLAENPFKKAIYVNVG